MLLPLLPSLVSANCGTPSWSIVPSEGTYNVRDGSGFFKYGRELCIIGGKKLQPVDCLDTHNNTWTRKATTVDNIHHIQPVWFRHEVWIVMGLTGKWRFETDIKGTLAYDPARDTLRTDVCAIPPEHSRGGAGVAVYDDYIYVVNGVQNGFVAPRGGNLRAVSRLHPDSCQWDSPLPAPQYLRDHYDAAMMGSRLVLAAGRNSTITLIETIEEPTKLIDDTTPPVEWIDLSEESPVWHTGAKIPTPRGGGTLIVDEQEGLVCILGGESANNTAASPEDMATCMSFSNAVHAPAHRELECYNVMEDRWLIMPPMVLPRQNAAAMLTTGDDGRQYIVAAGGKGCGGGSPLQFPVEVIAKPWGSEADAPCTCDDVLSNLAGDHSCSDRILYLINVMGLDQQAAQHLVGTEFPEECGPCLLSPPSSPPSPLSPPSAPPPSSPSPPLPLTCDDVLDILAPANGYTCGNRINWLESVKGMKEADAKKQVAAEFPAECGPCGD